MTTRDQVRRAVRADRGDAREMPAEPAPGLPERLLAARERKGVDLYRAERDTKIRVRYLAALERGDYRELPGNVYTKGFLRNYALYLGLDPDDVLLQWRRERGDPREPQAVITVPRPIATPRKGLTFSPSLVVFALMTVAGAGESRALVFDEVDAGVGGQTARAVGERLRALADARQVLCITHLPQIAALATSHFRIEKSAETDTALTTVEALEGDGVVAELCRMLGAEASDKAARQHAQELLAAA